MSAVNEARKAVALLARGKYAEALAMILRLPVLALAELDALFEAWASCGQFAPSGQGWRLWLVQGGRGFGKTRAGAEWVHGLAMARRCRVALVGATLDEARRVMVEGTSGLIEVARNHRILLNYQARFDKTDTTAVVTELLAKLDETGLKLPADVQLDQAA